MARKSPSSRFYLFLALFASPLARAVDSDFRGLYPDAALPCLNEASANSDCNGASSNKALNECLCSNGGNFVTNTASCLGEDADDQVRRVYQIMSDACLETETPLTVSQSDFIAISEGDSPSSSSSSSSSSTSSSTSSTSSEEPTETDDNSDGSDNGGSSGLSTGAIAGIGAGAGVLAIAVIGGLVAYCIRRRRRAGEESHPMLPSEAGNPYHGAATTFPPAEPSPGVGGQFDHDPKQGRWSNVSGLSPGGAMGGYSPAMTNNTVSPPLTGNMVSSWGSAPPGWNNGQYAGAYATPPPVAELPPQSAGPIYEMDGGHQQQSQGQFAAELSGSTPAQHPSYDARR